MQDKFPMTVEGAEKLKSELDKLKTIDRPRVTNAIAEARAHGDLKENAEYHAAREEQGIIEAQIKDLEHKQGRAQVIDINSIPKSGKVIFATTVVLEDLDLGVDITYKIVGEHESDISKGLLSYNTPIARALIGNEKGYTVEIETPGGGKSYEIKEVLYK